MYHAPVFANGDTRKQLLARSIYLLYKKESLWTQSQRIRAEILFKEYDIKKGYYLSMRLGLIYHQCKFKDIALTRLARGYDEVDKSGSSPLEAFFYLDIINFFERRATMPKLSMLKYQNFQFRDCYVICLNIKSLRLLR